jgi:hypothetical protein
MSRVQRKNFAVIKIVLVQLRVPPQIAFETCICAYADYAAPKGFFACAACNGCDEYAAPSALDAWMSLFVVVVMFACFYCYL